MDASGTHERAYLPGMGRAWLLPLYDPLVRLSGKAALDRALVEQADLAPGTRVLEIGCGTGSVALLAQRGTPGAVVHGLDPDPRALARAGRKAARARLPVHWDRGYAQELPYPDASFDRVLSVLMLHHLDPDDRAGTLREARRVLAPGGSLHVLDVGGTEQLGPRSHLARLIPSGHRLHEDVGTGLPEQLRAAGFASAVQVARRSHPLLGSLAFCRADVAPKG